MRFPLSLTSTMIGYIAKKKITGQKKFPLVLMLEPLHACNLTCTGCGRIREYETTIKQKLSVDECLAAVDECGAPIVSICGGEPMIYPEIGKLVSEILKRRKHIYLCTNGMFIQKKLHEFKPTSRFFFNVHLDGLRETHDRCVEREGVFDAAVEGIKAAKKAGFLVCTNTTVFKDTDINELDALYAYLTTLGVDGFMLSPAYGYAAVKETNPTGAADDAFSLPRRHPRQIQGSREAAQEIPHGVVADLLGIPQRQARIDLHRLGQSDTQYQRLERPLLSHHRRAP